MLGYLKLFLLLNIINIIWADNDTTTTPTTQPTTQPTTKPTTQQTTKLMAKSVPIDQLKKASAISVKNYMFWPNGTIPFYINPDHFDKEQTMTIMSALTGFAYKTCLLFLLVLTPPSETNNKVMSFVNPNGHRRCTINTTGSSFYENYLVDLGYDCLKPPHLEMRIMRALGFPFEHNRLSRDLYITVWKQNIEPGAVQLFTKDVGLPPEMRELPYDINSIMHFGERDYSKNGHKSFAFKSFKNETVKQNRQTLTETDLKKIDIVYGEECRKRDKQELIETCRAYPGFLRRKRAAPEGETEKSLRVNPNITPPPEVAKPTTNASENNATTDDSEITGTLKELGVDEETQTLVDNIFKLSSSALLHARDKYCNKTTTPNIPSKSKDPIHKTDIVGILELVGDYLIETVEKAVANLSVFCETPNGLEVYQRQRCKWNIGNCRPTYRSTKVGNVMYSTQHRPYIVQSTKVNPHHVGSYVKLSWRNGNETEETTTPKMQSRKKRDTSESKKTSLVKEKLQKEKLNMKEKKVSVDATKDSSNRRYFERRIYK